MLYAGSDTFWSCGYKYESPNYMSVVSKSTDGGITWVRHELYSGSTYGFTRAIAVDPADANTVYAIGYANSSYILYKTINGGGDWTEITPAGYTGTPYDMIVHPTNSSRIAIASSSGLYATTDGGENWSKVTTSFTTSNDLHQSELLNGLVIATTNGVWIWEEWTGAPVYYGEDPGTSNVHCVVSTEEHVFAGTTGSAVWRAYCAVDINDPNSLSIQKAEIVVSPNPICSGAASLSFCLSSGGYTSIALYDVSGRIVHSVTSEFMDSGNHEIVMNTSLFSPGIYFARVSGEELNISTRFVISR